MLRKCFLWMRNYMRHSRSFNEAGARMLRKWPLDFVQIKDKEKKLQ